MDETIRQIEAQCDAKLQQQADEYWDTETDDETEQPEPFCETTGPSR